MIPDDLSEIDKIETFVCGQSENANQSTCQELFTRKLFGLPAYRDERDTKPGDILLLYDYGNKNNPRSDDKYVYGPFRAESEMRSNIVPDAWGGNMPNQIKVSWEQLYRLPADKSPVNMFDNYSVTGDDAGNLLRTLIQDGQKIRVTSNGEREPIEEPDEDTDNNEKENEPEDSSPEDEDDSDPEGKRDIVELRGMAEPLSRIADLTEDANPGAALLRPAVSGEVRPELYREALTHLISGKNVIFYGPPGSGKTRIAERLSEAICSTVHIETANAEWTNQDVVGGYHPEDDGFSPTPGVLTKAAADCEASLSTVDPPHPSWLLIDELNRANLDEAFGEVFTLLDLSYRSTSTLRYADTETQAVPLAFRILGTMNSEDQAQLFSLGYAFRRRFAFVEVPPVYSPVDWEQPSASRETVELKAAFERIMPILEAATTEGFDQQPAVDNDSPLAIPYLETVFGVEEDVSAVIEDAYEEARETITPPDSPIPFDRALLGFVQALDSEGVASIGQGILIDAFKYIVLHSKLFPNETNWSVVDQAVVSYILPQLESYMVELRRSGTVASESNAEEAFKTIIAYASDLGFGQTATRLETAMETHEIIG